MQYDKYIKEINSRNNELVESFNASCAVLENRFEIVEADSDVRGIISGFHIFNTLKPHILKAYQGSGKKAYHNLLCIATHSSVEPVTAKGTRGFSTDMIFTGYMQMNRNFPVSILRPETMEDKLGKFLGHSEARLTDNKKFNSAFFITTKDAEKLELAFPPELAKELLMFPELMIEFNGRGCLYFPSDAAVSKEEAENFCRLTSVLMKYLQ